MIYYFLKIYQYTFIMIIQWIRKAKISHIIAPLLQAKYHQNSRAFWPHLTGGGGGGGTRRVIPKYTENYAPQMLPESQI